MPEVAQEAVSQDVQTGQADTQHEVGFLSHARAPETAGRESACPSRKPCASSSRDAGEVRAGRSTRPAGSTSGQTPDKAARGGIGCRVQTGWRLQVPSVDSTSTQSRCNPGHVITAGSC